MRSFLTPHVFRRLLRNEPIIHRDCLYRRGRQIRLHHVPRAVVTLAAYQRRSLFGWITPVPREAITATGEHAALAYIKDACARLDNQIRPPPTDLLAKAWTTFVTERHARKATLSDIEANYVRRVFELLKASESNDQVLQLITDNALRDALGCLPAADSIADERAAHEAFAAFSTTLFSELDARAMDEEDNTFWKQKDGGGLSVHERLWLQQLGILAKCGQTSDAHDAIARSRFPQAIIESAWCDFLHCLSENPDLPVDLGRIPGDIEQQVSPLSTKVRMQLATVFASRGDMANAQQYAVFQDTDGNPITNTTYYDALLRACRTHNALPWGRTIIKTLTSDINAMKSHQSLWNVTFKWALSTGKSVDEVNRMLDVMVSTNSAFRPRTEDINSFIQVAIELNDPYLAERLVTLGERWGCTLDEQTYLLQMDYRLSVGDIEGARVACDFVKSFQQDNEAGTTGVAGPRINKLIQSMCARKTYSFDTIMEAVDFLSAQGGRFEAPTVASLALLHLARDEYTDVADLLSMHVKPFSRTERALVRDRILNDLLLDPATPLSRLWDSYMIYQHVFDDAPREHRTAIMKRFFEQDRPDMAVHVFNHMRYHASPAINPDAETYVAALVGCGKTSDDEALAVVNNVLKMDVQVVETTRLHNARMLGFMGAGDFDKAQAVWDDLSRSDEGPSRNSLLLIFKVCQGSEFGEVRAREVWRLIRSMDVPLDSELVAAYVGALGGNLCDDDAKKLVASCEAELGVAVDDLIVATLFNWTLNQARQAEVEGWLKDRYPASWARLEAKGMEKHWNGARYFPIDEKLEP